MSDDTSCKSSSSSSPSSSSSWCPLVTPAISLRETWMFKNANFIFPSDNTSDDDADDNDDKDSKCDKTTTLEENERTNQLSSLTSPIGKGRRHRLMLLKRRWDDAVNVVTTRPVQQQQREQQQHHVNSKRDDDDDNNNNKKRSETKEKTRLEEISNKWFDRIVSHHTEPIRAYHTLCHLEEMFGYIDLFLPRQTNHENNSDVHHGMNAESNKNQTVTTNNTNNNNNNIDRAVLTMSIFFHDVVYNPKSNTNEDDSVLLFQQFLQDLQPQLTLHSNDDDTNNNNNNDDVHPNRYHWMVPERVVQYILATKTHGADSNDNNNNSGSNNDPYLTLFLDADMVVIAKSKQAYDAYAHAIRYEYQHVPHNTYCIKRSDILQKILDSKCIFGTKQIRNELEDCARINLRGEIQRLKGEIE